MALVMMAVVVVLVFICMAGSLNSYSGKRMF